MSVSMHDVCVQEGVSEGAGQDLLRPAGGHGNKDGVSSGNGQPPRRGGLDCNPLQLEKHRIPQQWDHRGWEGPGRLEMPLWGQSGVGWGARLERGACGSAVVRGWGEAPGFRTGPAPQKGGPRSHHHCTWVP